MSVISCKIGLIAKPRDSTQDCFLNLGEVFDKTIRENVNILYELHTIMKYMCPFKITTEGKNITPDNLEEIAIVQARYKLTRKIWRKGKYKSTKFLAPELYDISCMVPLFPDKVPRLEYPQSNETPMRMIILFPYEDPVVRGEIIDSCASISNERKTCFYAIGSVQGNNTRPTCDLSRRYLLSCGIQDDNIYREQYDTFPDCIIEALNMINFVLPDTEMEIMIAVSREDMQKVLAYIRMANALGKLEQRIQLMCN